MMSGLRDASKGFFGKIVVGILMGLLILSFAVWGINDVFQGGSATDVAKVGNKKITQAEYQDAYRRLLARIQRERGFAPTTAQMRAEGLDRRLLASLVNDTALDVKAQSLGLSYNLTDAARSITTDTRFQQGGAFNREMFNGFLQNANMSEQMYLRELAGSVLRRHVSEAVGGSMVAPQTVVELFNKRSAELRSIAFVRINESRIAAVAAPDDATLKTYFEANQANFRAPEYRSMRYLLLNPADFAADIVIGDADIQKDYADGLAAGRYGTPEKRTIQQLTFPDKTAALAALDRIKSGTGIDSIAVEMNQLGTLDAGARTKAEIGVAALADPIFALASGGVSEPIETGGQVLLVKVLSIAPAVVPPLDDALKASIAETLRKQRIATDVALRQKIGKLQGEIEDLRGSGKTLAEIAGDKKIAFVDVPAVDAAGRDKANTTLALPQAERLVAAVFGSAVGVDNEALAIAEGGWLWFEMTGREEARNLTLDESKARVIARWTEEEKARRIGARADELLKKAQTGTTLEQIASELGATVETAEKLQRFSQPFGAEAGTAIFVAPLNSPAIATVNRAETLLFRVSESTTPPLDPASDAAKQTKELLANVLSEDLVVQYVTSLETSAGVEVYESALANAIGAQ